MSLNRIQLADDEKHIEEQPVYHQKQQFKSNRTTLAKHVLFSIASLMVIGYLTFSGIPCGSYMSGTTESAKLSESLCPVGDTIRPQSYVDNKYTVDEIVSSPEYREYAIKNLEGAIRIPTVTHDDNKPPSESSLEWTEFPKFHKYLEETFPAVFKTFKVEKINEYGLLLTWTGSNKTLKPILFMGHQDVVPVEPVTLDDWTYPPFEGVHDETYIYGRGASDCKNTVISYFQGFDKLIKDGFEPKRSIVLSLGFDEEIGGPYGASSLAEHLFERYGADSFFAILDEGGASVLNVDGVPFATPAVGEKGNVGLEIELTTPGGHSSIPPEHTNIGIIAQLVSLVEATPFTPKISQQNPFLGNLQCFAKYTDSSVPYYLKNDVFKAPYDADSNARLVEYLSKDKVTKALISTTQAVDIIQGGVKSNALPEFTKIFINHRVSIDSSVQETIDKILFNVKAIAKDFDLGIYFFNDELVPKTNNGFFKVHHGPSLKPSKVSPLDNGSFDILRGTLKHILEDYTYPESTHPAIVSGSIMSGNTDTNKYWNLSDNIYRFSFSTLSNMIEAGFHTVNEKVKVKDFLEYTAFVYEYVRNIDEYNGN